VEEDNLIEEINSEVESDEDEGVVVPETEDKVVLETQESLQVVVFETQPKADANNQPHNVAAGRKCGGFHHPTASDGDAYSSYSQFSSQLSKQGYTCYDCGNGIATAWCLTWTDGVECTCADCK
jgi:hypothetical protein